MNEWMGGCAATLSGAMSSNPEGAREAKTDGSGPADPSYRQSPSHATGVRSPYGSHHRLPRLARLGGSCAAVRQGLDALLRRCRRRPPSPRLSVRPSVPPSLSAISLSLAVPLSLTLSISLHRSLSLPLSLILSLSPLVADIRGGAGAAYTREIRTATGRGAAIDSPIDSLPPSSLPPFIPPSLRQSTLEIQTSTHTYPHTVAHTHCHSSETRNPANRKRNKSR
eukprot:GHVU01041754.1.p1 GENE.GHVU01041754.1~~GHVU01041754.1.p1  ORF type:complete len:224 (-),score=9.49 GHVU01041754.1:456-1127(-)